MALNESSSSSSSSSSSASSEYERTRAVNIERNNARLRQLGLISATEEQESNDSAWKRTKNQQQSLPSESNKYNNNQEDKRTLNNNHKRQRKPLASTPEPTRKSLRVQGKDLVQTKASARLHDGENGSNDTLQQERRQQQVEECRQARQLAALRYSQLTNAEKRAAQENPTATYEHCLRRVKTMTGKALHNRIRAIERSTGKHCVVKMAIFKSCLQDEGMWELADAASQALERLKALQPPSE